MTGTTSAGEGSAPPNARPTTLLTGVQLFQISIFWFALNAIWGGFEIFQQKRVIQLVGSDEAGFALGAMDLLAAPLAMFTMPVVGSISDYAATRWGRRRPFILVGSLAAGLSLVGLALAPSLPTLVACFLALQLTANVARGPFAGLVPDLVPEAQVGMASGLMGLMITLGLIGGNVIIWSGYLLGEDFSLPVIALGVLVAATGVGTFLLAPTGPPPKPREGRSWATVALETFGTDILRERSYLFLLASRFFILMGGGFFMNLNILFLVNVFGLEGEEQQRWVAVGLVVAAVTVAAGTIPGARLSDRVGRKPVIYGSAVIGGVGMAIIAAAPSVPVVMLGLGLIGLGNGAFLAVDWALMTDIIPKASAGRYMGLSNIVEAANGAVASFVGGFVISGVGVLLGAAVGARTAMALGVVVFVVGALLLIPVREPPRARVARVAPAPTLG